VFEFLSLRTGVSFSDFRAVVTSETGTEVVVELYFNIGKDNYSRLKTQPISVMVGDVATATYTFHNQIPLISTLPAGTAYSGKINDSPYQPKVTSGIGAPVAAPIILGQEYLDTTNKKAYKAFGTSSISDWVLLN
jgi:hypothetical protein